MELSSCEISITPKNIDISGLITKVASYIERHHGAFLGYLNLSDYETNELVQLSCTSIITYKERSDEEVVDLIAFSKELKSHSICIIRNESHRYKDNKLMQKAIPLCEKLITGAIMLHTSMES